MLNCVELYYYLATQQLSNEDYNKLIEVVKETGNEHVFNTSLNTVKLALNEFLLGKYKLVRVDEKEL